MVKKKREGRGERKSDGIAVMVRMGPSHAAAFKRYLARSETPPNASSVLLRALEKFLKDYGLWPPSAPPT